MSERERQRAKIEVGLACGRNYLSVNDFVVAVEGDICRDAELPGTHWNRELLETVASGKTREHRPIAFTSLPAIDAEAEYRAQKLKDREEHDAFVAKHLKETFAVVEANSNETHTLWADWSIENPFRVRDPRDQRQSIYWEEISRGFYEALGELRFGKEDAMPVVLSAFWARLRVHQEDAGKLVMFWDLCSKVTDYRMAEKFIGENVPKPVIKTDAMNFHNVIHALRDSR